MYSPLFATTLVIALLMTSIWLVSICLRDASIIDIGWGVGFVAIAWVIFVQQSILSKGGTSVLLPIMVTLWGLRLSLYLYWRNHGRPEDYRYQQMRKKWGQSFWWISFFTVFMIQGIVMWLVSLPIQFGIGPISKGVTFSQRDIVTYALLVVGVATWATGLFIETLADWQMARFKANQKHSKSVLDSGLWRYSRHPNYFGESLVWWGIYGVALANTLSIWLILSPMLMTFLLLRVSGVTLLESNLRATKPEYVDYVRRTSSFFPWPPWIRSS